ncbi:hypothetical protein BC828DRAFT_271168 [Blastocladiella britannica]|nr:hypothetical protein BC828DRAFT_271168 [Blastocladiella britannica]
MSLDDQAEYQKILHSREAYLNFMREHMVREEFPATLQGRILLQERFEFSWHQGLDIGKLLSDLPVSLHHDVLRHLYWDMFAKVPMFKDSDEAFQLDLMKRLTTVTLPANFYTSPPSSQHWVRDHFSVKLRYWRTVSGQRPSKPRPKRNCAC